MSLDELLSKNPEVTLLALKEALKQTYNSSLFATARGLLGFKDVNRKTHGDIISCLESEEKRKLIVVPRGCLKSTLACVAYPIFRLNNKPNLRILIDSELYTNSKTFLREIRLHLVSPTLTNVFGSYESSTWNESELIIKQRTARLKEASITVGGIGTTKVGQHYDIIIMDDMNSPDNSNTPEACEKVINHYKYNTSILEPDGEMVIIGTRYSERDLIGWILYNELGILSTPTTGVYNVGKRGLLTQDTVVDFSTGFK